MCTCTGLIRTCLLTLLAQVSWTCEAADILLRATSPSLEFDGVGALSAGASSRLLRDYSDPFRSQILDFLFLPSFGAALQVHKFTIGGDGQEGDGTEPSFRHTREEPPVCGLQRGFEMWLANEAYKRNPDILFFILAWGVPGWVGNGSYFSEENIAYQTQYATCIRETIGKAPFAIGIWNERSWGSVEYVVSLRQSLDAAGLASTKIIVPDGAGCKDVVPAAAANSTFFEAIYALGEHYPCKNACPRAAEIGLKYWASEDYSTVADWAGAGCWGRSLNQNFILLNATSTIAWSTIWSVYPAYPWYGNALMYAFSPWSGNYTLNAPLWTSAHWTQFILPRWALLLAGEGGSGLLPLGGSYVAAFSPSMTDFSLVIETLHGSCLRCAGDAAVPAQNLSFVLTPPGFAASAPPGTLLHTWRTTELDPFVRLADTLVQPDGSVSIFLPADAMVTLSTVASARHGAFALPVPSDAPFPLPYSEMFQFTPEDGLARYFADQAGSFAVRGGVLRQVAGGDPGSNGWLPSRDPITLIGANAWEDISATVEVFLPTTAPLKGEEEEEEEEEVLLQICDDAAAPSLQSWLLNTPAPGYLANSLAPLEKPCLAVDGCGANVMLWECITQGGTCAGPQSYANLQWDLRAADNTSTDYFILQSRLPPGFACATAHGSGLRLSPCSSNATQVWTRRAVGSGSGALQLRNNATDLCLSLPPAPPPPPRYTQLCIRAASFETMNSGAVKAYCLRVTGGGDWEVWGGGSAPVASGPVPAFAPTQWQLLSLSAAGNTLSAGVNGAQLWSGNQTSFANGQVALGCGWHDAAFRNFTVS